VRDADQAGVDTVWVVDHLLQADPTAAPGETEMLEAYTTLGFLAGQAERVRLGTMVTFRPPALLVKAVTTLDVLSGGRAWMGLGAGYQAEEAEAMGLPLPPVAERFERLEETLQIRCDRRRKEQGRVGGVDSHISTTRDVVEDRQVADRVGVLEGEALGDQHARSCPATAKRSWPSLRMRSRTSAAIARLLSSPSGLGLSP
jgi:hypothetical protein